MVTAAKVATLRALAGVKVGSKNNVHVLDYNFVNLVQK